MLQCFSEVHRDKNVQNRTYFILAQQIKHYKPFLIPDMQILTINSITLSWKHTRHLWKICEEEKGIFMNPADTLRQ